jgi:hypothetical protein
MAVAVLEKYLYYYARTALFHDRTTATLAMIMRKLMPLEISRLHSLQKTPLLAR